VCSRLQFGQSIVPPSSTSSRWSRWMCQPASTSSS
jgi:hypothetical protein